MGARESQGGDRAASQPFGLAALACDVERLVLDDEDTAEMPPVSEGEAADVLAERAAR